jgi:hypothetical protein
VSDFVWSDESVQSGVAAFREAVEAGELDDEAVVRAVMEAVTKDVPPTNYGICLALNFFDLVICVKDHPGHPAVGAFRRDGDDPEAFLNLGGLGIDVSYGHGDHGRWIKRLAVSTIPEPEEAPDA